MPEEPIVRRLKIRNLLSFRSAAIDLRGLNVLIGPNGSGKTNLVEVLGLLQNAPGDLARTISKGGPIEEWLWKGAEESPTASIEASISKPPEPAPLRYFLEFAKVGFRFEITGEEIEVDTDGAIGFEMEFGRGTQAGGGVPRDFNPRLSILAQRKDPEHYPKITYLGDQFSNFRLYRDWEFGGVSDIRGPCDASLPNQHLAEDGSNLSVVLDRLLARPPVKNQILEYLRLFNENAADLRTSIEGGMVQTRLEEKHLNATIPLVRLSDGTIRWLALLTILLNPDPPPLVCIEEPELGLHPDMIHELGKLLIDASTRMQLIVATHSDRLIEEFTETPESVVVCEKRDGASQFRRLDARDLAAWLDRYSLGQLWTKGQIGGTRW
jgi:predicted ATPase